ncbi:MAG: hypothetical protein J6V41_05035 [Kiritimatiellae bacterium]|nr:hypothetical protein [Kiritimatiellia bacterium]
MKDIIKYMFLFMFISCFTTTFVFAEDTSDETDTEDSSEEVTDSEEEMDEQNEESEYSDEDVIEEFKERFLEDHNLAGFGKESDGDDIYVVGEATVSEKRTDPKWGDALKLAIAEAMHNARVNLVNEIYGTQRTIEKKSVY